LDKVSILICLEGRSSLCHVFDFDIKGGWRSSKWDTHL
jgi:hypothetical protein